MTITLSPALRGKFGNWEYWYTTMKVQDAVREIRLPHELFETKAAALDKRIQRELQESKRVLPMAEYLTRPDRFYGPLIVAIKGGNPAFVPVEVAEYTGLVDPSTMEFGILRFDGSQTYFVLDGQHRMASFAKALEAGNDDIKNDEIGIIIVRHEETDEGMIQSRRLFTHINRYAKATTMAENITIDEDDGIAITTRRLLRTHPLLKERVHLDARSLPARGSQKLFTSLETVYRCCGVILQRKYDITREWKRIRPEPERLEQLYEDAKVFWDALTEHVPEIREVVNNDVPPGHYRPEDPKDEAKRGQGHLLFRPIGQEMLATAVAEAVHDTTLDLNSVSAVIAKATKVDWRLSSPPWLGVFFGGGRMLTGRDRRDLGVKLLRYILGTEWPDENKLLSEYGSMIFADPDSEEARKLQLPPRIT